MNMPIRYAGIPKIPLFKKKPMPLHRFFLVRRGTLWYNGENTLWGGRIKSAISPSMMCADISGIPETLGIFEKNGIEYLHIDIMDGHFVPNFTLGTDYCRSVKKLCNIPLDIHLMVENPEKMLDWFPIAAGDMVSVHTESTKNIKEALRAVRAKGAKAFAAINPPTPADVLYELLDDIDGVLVMAVNPGFAGQKMVDGTLEKIRAVREMLDENGKTDVIIEVDGNVSFENSVKMKNAGADIFVVGTSSVFSAQLGVERGIEKMRGLLKGD